MNRIMNNQTVDFQKKESTEGLRYWIARPSEAVDIMFKRANIFLARLVLVSILFCIKETSLSCSSRYFLVIRDYSIINMCAWLSHTTPIISNTDMEMVG